MLRYPACIAPFIADYVLEETPEDCWLLECHKCGFRFFDHRFDADEVRRLYANYRSDRYFVARHAHEFWYTRAINDRLGRDAADIAARQDVVAGLLRASLGEGILSSILDYGGDRGQFIPAGMAARNYVYEVSDAEATSEVVRLSDISALTANGPYSLIMLCHVLEHYSEPDQLLRQLIQHIVPRTGLLFVEVPYERHKLAWSIPKLTYRFRKWFASRSLIGKVHEIYTLLFRKRWNLVPPLGLIRLHEHINFFAEESLTKLLDQVGFEVINLELHPIPSPIGQTTSLMVLARQLPSTSTITGAAT